MNVQRRRRPSRDRSMSNATSQITLAASAKASASSRSTMSLLLSARSRPEGDTCGTGSFDTGPRAMREAALHEAPSRRVSQAGADHAVGGVAGV